jgi:hypothetical protein
VAPPALPEGEVRGTVGQYATDYLDATAAVRDGRLTLAFAGDATVGLLEPAPADRGRVWWSGRGDGANPRLTRTFDLTGVETARLVASTWYALEANWDYAYFTASADGGATWTRLATERTTDDDPNGNNYGHGLTGKSGGWVDTALDLTPLAGGAVTVRYEVVTDDAIHLAGLALDDIRLEADGATVFADDAEADAGWRAEGWVRIDPRLPQRWGVQVVVHGDDVLEVHRPPVGLDGRARLALADVPGYAQVTVAVSGLTPSPLPAGYTLSSATSGTVGTSGASGASGASSPAP